MILLDNIARRYGCRPSTLMGFASGSFALAFDALCALTGKEVEVDAIKAITDKGGTLFPSIVVSQ